MSDDHDVKLSCGCRDCYRGSTVERDPCRRHAREAIVNLTAQLATAEREARNAGARAAELWAFVQYVRSREHTIAEMDAYADRLHLHAAGARHLHVRIAEMDAYADRLHDEGPYEIGQRIIADLTAARARADALEAECAAMREALERAAEFITSQCLSIETASAFATDASKFDFIRAALSGTAGKRAAEVVALARKTKRIVETVDANGKYNQVEFWRAIGDLRAALAALGES